MDSEDDENASDPCESNDFSDVEDAANTTKIEKINYDVLPSLTAGFEEDCEDLISKFLERNSIRFRTFFDLWKETKFELTFSGRPSFLELCEFSQEAINVAARILFSSSTDDNYQKCIAGLYLVYMIHNIDMVTKRATIRVLPSSVTILLELKEYARTCGHHDVLYILCSMLRDGVFRFVATSREYGYEFAYWKYTDKDSGSIKLKNNREDFKVKFSIEDEINELSSSLKRYQELKCGLSENEMPPKELNYIDEKFPEKLLDSLKALEHNQEKKPETSVKNKLQNAYNRKRASRKRLSVLNLNNPPTSHASHNIKGRNIAKSVIVMAECMVPRHDNESEDELLKSEPSSTLRSFEDSDSPKVVGESLPLIREPAFEMSNSNVVFEFIDESDAKNKEDEMILGI